jgi:hypothetical protein
MPECDPIRKKRCNDRDGRTCHVNSPSGRITCRKKKASPKRKKCPEDRIKRCNDRDGRTCHVNSPSGRITCRKKRKSPCKPMSMKAFENEDALVKSFNCDQLPLKNIKHILGPCSFLAFKIGDRNLYLFGEYHTRLDKNLQKMKDKKLSRDNTLSFSSFVHSLAKQNPKKTYDLMYESQYFYHRLTNPKVLDTLKPEGSLDEIDERFKNCMIPFLRKNCPYKNLRTHYVDYRRYLFIPKTVDRDFVDFLLEERLTSDARIFKQMAAIKDSKIRDALFDFFRSYNYDDEQDGSQAACPIMDVYAFSRILRDFNIAKKKGKQFSGTSQNVIYYAGEYHIQTFAAFLQFYLKLEPFYQTPEDFPNPVDDTFVTIDMTSTHML